MQIHKREMGKKWLMIDLEDDNKQYEDIKKIINIKVCGK